MSASLKASSNRERPFDLPVGLPLTPGTQRCGFPGLNDVSGLPDLPGSNLFFFDMFRVHNLSTIGLETDYLRSGIFQELHYCTDEHPKALHELEYVFP